RQLPVARNRPDVALVAEPRDALRGGGGRSWRDLNAGPRRRRIRREVLLQRRQSEACRRLRRLRVEPGGALAIAPFRPGGQPARPVAVGGGRQGARSNGSAGPRRRLEMRDRGVVLAENVREETRIARRRAQATDGGRQDDDRVHVRREERHERLGEAWRI